MLAEIGGMSRRQFSIFTLYLAFNLPRFEVGLIMSSVLKVLAKLKLFFFLLIAVPGISQNPIEFGLRDESDLHGIDGAEIKLDIKVNGTIVDNSKSLYTLKGLKKGNYSLMLEQEASLEGMSIDAEGYRTISLTKVEFDELRGTIFLQRNAFEVDEVVQIVDRAGEPKEKVAGTAIEISSREISLMNAQTSADLLQNSGEVFVQKSQMGGGSPNIRGFEANKVLIVVDGVRMNNAIFRGGHLQNVIAIDQNMLDKVEVLYGPGSVMYGSDALGGVMHFYTRKPEFSDGDRAYLAGNAFLRTASANFEKTGHFDLNIGGNRLSSLTSVTASDYDDLVSGKSHPKDYPDFGKRPFYADRINGRDTALANDNIHRQRYSGYSQVDILQKFLFRQKNPAFTHGLNLQLSTSTDVPRYDRLSEYDGTDLKYSSWYYGPQKRFAATYQGKMANLEGRRGYNSLTWTLAYQNLEESRHTRRFGNNSLRNRTENVQVFSANVDGQTRFNPRHKVSYGVEAVYNDVSSVAFQEDIETNEVSPLSTRYPDGGSTMLLLAGYLWDSYDIIVDKLTFSGGFRLNQIGLDASFVDNSFFPFLPDNVQQNSFAPSGSAGLAWRPTDKWKFRGVIATGFRAPNVDDVAKTFDSEPGTVIIPNADLQPEYTYNLDLGVRRLIGDFLEIELTGFGSVFDNALQVRGFSVNGQDSILYDGILSRVQALQNVKQAMMGGFNFRVNWDITDRFELRHTVSLTRAREVETGVPLDHIPPLFGRTEIRYQQKRLLLQLFAQYNGWKRLDDYSPSGEDNLKFATVDGTPAWYTLNLKGSFAITEKFQIQGGIENLLDRHYRVFASGISAPGRNFMLTLRSSF